MKSTFKFLWVATLLGACGSDDPAVSQDEAAVIAEGIVGGDAGEVERGLEGTTDVWEVHVAMPNTAEIEVKIDVDTADLVVVEDKTGPFDYADFTPLSGVLSYDAITEVALTEVPGVVEAWEFKVEEEDELEWEFYVRDDGNQLWEIKFDATNGTVTSLEMKAVVDP